jgi:hypothetical protein
MLQEANVNPTNSQGFVYTLNARQNEVRKIRPIAQPSRIPSNPYPLRNTRYTIAIKDEEHKPRRRTCVRIRRRRDRTRRSTTTECREVCPLPHTVTMRAAHRAHKRYLRGRTIEHSNRDRITVPIARLVVIDQIRRLCRVAHEIGGNEDLNAVLLDVGSGFGVRARDEDAAVEEQDGFRVVQAVDGGVGEDSEARVEGRSGVVEHGVVVGFAGEAEAGEALHRAV